MEFINGYQYPTEQGRIYPNDRPGLGVDIDRDMVETLTLRQAVIA
jgi:L-alanine-DL-glutamate epimerase-like enolase superfamily enzyme